MLAEMGREWVVFYCAWLHGYVYLLFVLTIVCQIDLCPEGFVPVP